MASPGKDNFRMKSYKNNALNPQEMRRRREEEGIQLRKQKREEQVSILGSCSLWVPVELYSGAWKDLNRLILWSGIQECQVECLFSLHLWEAPGTSQ